LYLYKNLRSSTAAETDFFLENQFGSIVLPRDRIFLLVSKYLQDQLALSKSSTHSIYLSGCRGTGKTSMLLLLCDFYSKKGYLVYFFDSAASIPMSATAEFVKVVKDTSKKVFIAIDEIFTLEQSPIYVTLMKGNFPNLIIFGAAVPYELGPRHTAHFRHKIGMSDLVLRSEDKDFLQLVEKIVSLNKGSPEVIFAICNHILEYCGGHLFPTLRFIEVFFTKPELKEFILTFESFFTFFHSSCFSENLYYVGIINRCFTSSGTAAVSAFKLLNSSFTQADVDSLERVGWLDKKKRALVSKLLETFCLKSEAQSSPTANRLTLLPTTALFDNVKCVIIEGFSRMDVSDLSVIETAYTPIENALSFNWAKHVCASFTNIHIDAQVTSKSGYVDYYVDGYCDHAVEFIRNATLSKSDEHLKRFLDGKYHWKNFVIVNFAMKGTDVVLPSDSKYHDIFFTYVHTTNTLYQGAKAIKSPATRMASPRLIDENSSMLTFDKSSVE
jgi:hypothetical protein